MNHIVLKSAAWMVLCQLASADEFLLSVEYRVGTAEFPAGSPPDELPSSPQEEVTDIFDEWSSADAAADPLIYQMDVLVEEGVPFETQTHFGREHLELSGKFRLDEEGKWRVHIRHARRVDTGQDVTIAPGVTERIYDELSVSTSVVVPPEEACRVGGSASSSTERGPDGVVMRKVERQNFLVRVTRGAPTVSTAE